MHAFNIVNGVYLDIKGDIFIITCVANLIR